SAERQAVGGRLSHLLRPLIEVRVQPSEQLSEYESAIAAMLRGSGLKYNALAPLLAEALTPRELAAAIEQDMPEVVSECTSVSRRRANRIVLHSQSVGTESILTCRVDDGVHMSLLSGGDYRPIDDLSTGQRCTVILPIILASDKGSLVIDQPEDHLDNAFIVEAVIKAIRRRRPGSQIICATHNPNIPVLGEAEQVVLLDSDGRSGFVRHEGPLDDPASVEAITSIMEGGREAFARRAEFYGRRNSAE
ncbi:MAG: AAA family ATPase, partial [Planctomycetota bacterium]